MEENNQIEKADSVNRQGMKIVLPLVSVSILIVLAGGYFLMKKNTTPESNVLSQDKVMGISQQAPEQSDVNQIVKPTAITVANSFAEIVIDGSSFKFNPSEFTVSAGQKVKLVFNNSEGFHDLVFETINVKTKQLQSGQTETLEFTAPEKPGVYVFYCSVGNHRVMGMVGKMKVE